MERFTRYLIILIIIILISLISFSIIYYNCEGYEDYFSEAFHLSVQIQTGIGIDVTNYQRFPAIKNWTTVQSVIAYICNILIVILISIYIGQNVTKETASIVVK